MAANFWTSSHLKWLVPRESLATCQAEDRQRGLSEGQLQQLKGHFTQYIFDLANSTNLRQRVAATAVVYFRRVYVTSSYARHDPRVVAPGCLYLASKAEESVVSAKVLLAAARRLRPGWPLELRQLLDAEMLILEELDARLLVFSPYLALTKLLASDPQLSDLGQNAWAALNDAHRTDLPLVHAPHMLAVGCVYLASVVCSRDIRAWLAGVEVDLNEVYSLSMDLIAMYEQHRAAVPVDDANRLLAVARPPAAGA
ncbi:cyclin-C1-like [Raphidocelis subcapitata]|uniref:Cyclin-C1-like n=1 Tax=Raphidocelis subcapitata TaxID=307507 RepID=A0A2V0NY15_9CHLO|nr:cyclin-C1-like [Raphidocelis subcapitata]|eukprot:GBF92528.1 cyclin-C1-like [Raphidocelis subcapitata]